MVLPSYALKLTGCLLNWHLLFSPETLNAVEIYIFQIAPCLWQRAGSTAWEVKAWVMDGKVTLPCLLPITGLPNWHHFPGTVIIFFKIIILSKSIYQPISLMPFVACSVNVAGFCHNFQVFPTGLYSLDAWVRIGTSLTMLCERIKTPAYWSGKGINAITI